jgi:magnesium transporter
LSRHIRAWLFDADGRDRVIDIADGVPTTVGERQLLWVDVDVDAEGALDELAERFEFDDRTRRRLEEDERRARISRLADRLHVTIEALEPRDLDVEAAGSPIGDLPLVRREIDLVARPGVVLSVHRGRVGAIERQERSLEGDTTLGILDAGDLLSTLIDEVINGYFLVIEGMEREIDALDDVALRGRSTEEVLDGIARLRRRANIVRRMLTPHRGVLAALVGPVTRADEGIGDPWPGLLERLDGAVAAAEALRDALLGTYDLHMGRMAQRQNGVMLALTMLSAILLPAVVLAGVMGMNFKLPFFEQPSNFFLVVGAMVLFALLLLGFARWRRWV